MNPRGSAFTLIELLVAMAVGLILVLVAMVAVRTTVQTAALANRLGLENRLMRQGVLEALDELDYWTRYDDPLDPAHQGLRSIVTMPAVQRNGVIESEFTRLGFKAKLGRDDVPWVSPSGVMLQPDVNSKLKLGGAFSPLQGFPTPLANDFGAVDPLTVRAVLPSGSATWASLLLTPVTNLQDDSSQAAGDAYALDRDRGFDPLRPFQANDPRRWYRGNLHETPGSDKRFGRYAMLTNLWAEPMLGYGSDPRELCSFGRSSAGMAPGRQAVTGPYGPYPEGDYARWGMRSRTWTWYSNQVVFLWEALGNIGLAEYLPSGTIIDSYGTRVFHPKPPSTDPETVEPYLTGINDPAGPTIRPTVRDTSRQDDNHARMDERQDFRFSGFPHYHGYTGTYVRSQAMVFYSGSHSAKPRTTWDATWDATYPLLAPSDYTGAAVVGMSQRSAWDWGNFTGDGADNTAANTILPLSTLAIYHRMTWAGPSAHTSYMRPLENRSQLVEPLMIQKPSTWPDLGIIAQRVIHNGRFTSIARVRWADPVSGEIAELGVTSIGTTLRGARQQRKPGGGWATFFGVNDPRNDNTLDSP